MQMEVYSASDWAADLRERKSVSAFVASLGGVALHAGCRTQTVVAQSSGEAEYIAATHAASQATYFHALVVECLGKVGAPTLHVDSTAAIGTASRRGLQRLRHLDTRFLWLQGEVAEKRLRLKKVAGPENAADSNTKACDHKSLVFCRQRMGLIQLEAATLVLMGLVTKGKAQEDIEEEAVEWSTSAWIGAVVLVVVTWRCCFPRAAEKKQETMQETHTKDVGVQADLGVEIPARVWTTRYGKKAHLFEDCASLVHRSTRDGRQPDPATSTETCRYCDERWRNTSH